MSQLFRALVLSGEGINCERETAHALKLAGFEVEISTLNNLIEQAVDQSVLESRFSLIAFPGGFSYGDELGSGRVLALKIQSQLQWDLIRFAKQGGLVIAICNGFQALIRLGVFGKNVSITRNKNNQFINRWVRLDVKQDSDAGPIWFQGLQSMNLPIRHGEGRIVIEGELSGALPALTYQVDVNGSHGQWAGLSAVNGRILGLMPHPEAFVEWTQAPFDSDHSRPDGRILFESAFKNLREGNRHESKN